MFRLADNDFASIQLGAELSLSLSHSLVLSFYWSRSVGPRVGRDDVAGRTAAKAGGHWLANEMVRKECKIMSLEIATWIESLGTLTVMIKMGISRVQISCLDIARILRRNGEI